MYTTPTADNIAAIIPGHFDDEPTHHRREDCFVNDIVLNPIRNTDKPFRINAKHRFTDPLCAPVSQRRAGLASRSAAHTQVILYRFALLLGRFIYNLNFVSVILLRVHVCYSDGTVADRGQQGNERCSITPKEWAAYYLSVRAESATWQDNMRLFRARRLFEVS